MYTHKKNKKRELLELYYQQKFLTLICPHKVKKINDFIAVKKKKIFKINNCDYLFSIFNENFHLKLCTFLL